MRKTQSQRRLKHPNGLVGASVSSLGVNPAPNVNATPNKELLMAEQLNSERIKHLEHEGDIAADYLEELLDIADLDGDIDLDVEGDRASVAIVTEPSGERWLRSLVGEEGEVLNALQDLTRLAVQTKTGERSGLMLDVAGHRRKRREALRALAQEAIKRVQESGESVEMEPMNPFERKVVHDVVAEVGLASESEGSEPNRRVIISVG